MADSNWVVWLGRVISALVCAVFVMSGAMKVIGGPELTEGIAHLGLPVSMVIPLAVIELSCVALYAIPQTSVLGAILLTGYLGGAISTHWRVGDSVVTPLAIGMLVWLGLYFREARLKPLVPVRTSAS